MSKLYNVSIYLDINMVSCPGVWLCPKGKAFLKICLFGVSDLTKEVEPFFPLVFKERFHFQKVFKNINSVYELHDKLGRSIISLELLQCPIGSAGCVKLALFNALLSDILHPYTTCFSKPLHTSGLELLFTTCKVFPGIIAPKADVSTKVMVTDTLDGSRTMKMQGMRSRFVNDDEKKKQQKVCHTKNNTNCRCFQGQGDPIEERKTQRSAETAESEESQRIVPHDMQASGSRRTERDVHERMDNVNVRTVMGDLEDQRRVSRLGREEEIASSNLKENGSRRGDYDRRGNVRPRTDIGDVGDHISRISKETGVLSIGATAAIRPTTVPEDRVSNRPNVVSKYGERPSVYNGNRYDMVGTDNEISEEHVLGRINVDRRTHGESRQQRESEDKHRPKKMTSCERFLLEHDFEEIKRTNDQLLREKYFKCYKGRRTDAPSRINREREETSRDISSQLMNEKAQGSVPQRSSKGGECGECTCLKSHKKKFESKNIAAKDLRPKGTFPHGDNGKHEYVSSRNGVERELAVGAMPPKSEYQEQYGDHRDQPRRIRSRSNVELYSSQFNQKHGDRSAIDLDYIRDEGGWKPRELQAGEMAPRSGYRDQSKEYQEPSQVGSVKPGYPNLRTKIVPEMTRKNDRNRASRRYESDLDQTRITRTIAKAQPEGQRHMPDSRNGRDNRNAMPSDKVEPRVENPSARPTYDHDIRNPEDLPESSETDDETSGEECKCTLCKNYQETYKPRTHPCPWFRKTAQTTMKIRQSKSNTGPKKVIPSRRSTVTKTHMGASKKIKTSSEDPKDCGFVNCDTLDYDFIGNKKDIKKFYGQT